MSVKYEILKRLVKAVNIKKMWTGMSMGDYCDFKLKIDEKPMEYWPPVFEQGKGYK